MLLETLLSAALEAGFGLIAEAGFGDAICDPSEQIHAIAVEDFVTPFVMHLQTLYRQNRLSRSAHPRIGEPAQGAGREAEWSRREQSRAATDDARVRAALTAASGLWVAIDLPTRLTSAQPRPTSESRDATA